MIATGAAGCATARATSVATGAAYEPHSGPVTVQAVGIPEGAEELGIVQADGTAELPQLVQKFADEVARLGGNYGKIDALKTRFEMATRQVSESYNCGTYKQPKTCYRTKLVTEEVGTTTVQGRAFRLPGGTP